MNTRWRLLLAVFCIVVVGALALARALQEPSAGIRLEQPVRGEITAVPLDADQPALQDVRRLSSALGAVNLSPSLLVETAGVLNLYADQDRFYATHRELWHVLQASEVTLEHRGGSTTLPVRAKRLNELGVRFLTPWLAGLLALSIGLGVWVYSPARSDVRCYLVASSAYAFTMMNLATTGSRLMTQPPWEWQELLMATHIASFLLNGGLALLLWNHPSRLGGRWFAAAVVAWSCGWLVLDYGQLVSTITMGFRLPATLAGPVIALLFGLQWRASRGDPVKRAQIKWLFLLFAVAMTTVFGFYAVTLTTIAPQVRQAYVMSGVSLLFVGLLPLVTRLGLFQLEGWWVSAWLWFLGGALLVALDLALVSMLSVGSDVALTISLALFGWLYFPLRQYLWRRLSDGARPSAGDVLPEIVALTALGGSDPLRLRQAWLALWDKVFRAQQCEIDTAAATGVSIERQGRILRIASVPGLPGLRLTLASRGARLFSTQDIRSADEIRALVERGLLTQEAVDARLRAERQRIAGDLHDDLGARLLTIAHAGGAPEDRIRVSQLARQALDDMRLAVRGLSGSPAALEDLAADWRAETLSRLANAGLEGTWQAEELASLAPLSPHLHTNLTRMLREAISNAIRHSGATQCDVAIKVKHGRLCMTIADNGCGLPGGWETGVGSGNGLLNLQRRAAQIGGEFRVTTAPGQGSTLEIELPVDASWHAARPAPA
jgi:signal transduction histidine kinase